MAPETLQESTHEPKKSAGRLAGLYPAMLLLCGSDRAIGRYAGGDCGRMWLFVGLGGIVWGVFLACLWSLSSICFSWYSGLPLMPAAAVLVAMTLGPSRRALAAIGSPGSQNAQGTASAVCVAVLALALVGLAPHSQDWSLWMPRGLRWLRPEVEYRVLMLMPMWGVWAMMTPVHFCRMAEGAEPLVLEFGKRQPVIATALFMAMPLALTLWYFNFLGGWAMLPAVLALAAGSVGAVFLCCRRGGCSREALLGANLATQMVFLLGYLAAKAP